MNEVVQLMNVLAMLVSGLREIYGNKHCYRVNNPQPIHSRR